MMNLKTKIIAADLKNLTDARYFAAWGVDYMGFVIDNSIPDHIDKIKEMMDWVEGPQHALQITGLEELSTINNQLMKLGIDHIITGPYATESILNSDWQLIRSVRLDDLSDLPAHQTYIVQTDLLFTDIAESSLTILTEFCIDRSVYLDCTFTAMHLSEIIDTGIEGIILRGGEEEKVGVKTYDDLDEILEWLEE